MMSSEPQPSRTAEKSRFSMMAVRAIHHLRRYAWAKLGAMMAGSTKQQETFKRKTRSTKQQETKVLLRTCKWNKSWLCTTLWPQCHFRVSLTWHTVITLVSDSLARLATTLFGGESESEHTRDVAKSPSLYTKTMCSYQQQNWTRK